MKSFFVDLNDPGQLLCMSEIFHMGIRDMYVTDITDRACGMPKVCPPFKCG